MNATEVIIYVASIGLFFCLGALLGLNIYNSEGYRINYFYLEDSTVDLSPSVSAALHSIYSNNMQFEIPICLFGDLQDKRVVITSFIIPEIKESNRTSSVYNSCELYAQNDKFVGVIHNHPGGNCVMSKADLQTHFSQIYDGREIQGIYCGQDELYFYALSRVPAKEVK